MLGYILRRIARGALVVVLVSMAAFALLHLAPGGPAGLFESDPRMTEADIARIRANLGLDDPLPVQYIRWFARVFVRLDFGRSWVTGESVAGMIGDRLPATLELMATAFIAALLLAVAMGIVSAARRDSLADELFSILSTIGMSCPIFWLGLMAIGLLSVRLGILPSGGRETIAGDAPLFDHLRHLALPAAVLAIGFLASWSRYLRSGIIEASSEDFLRTARAKGLGEGAVLGKHALRVAALPLVTAVTMQIPALFTGAVVTETVFSWPGMGRMFYDGLLRHDHPRVLGIVVVSSLLVLVGNAVGDIICAAMDPRIGRAEGRDEEPRRAGEGGRA